MREAATSEYVAGRESHCVTMFKLSHEQGISLHLSPYRTKQIKINAKNYGAVFCVQSHCWAI